MARHHGFSDLCLDDANIVERNTFLELAPPAQLILRRSTTEPAREYAMTPQPFVGKCTQAPILLEVTLEESKHLGTCDVHRLLESLHATVPSPLSLHTPCALWPPTPMSPEYFGTADSFQPFFSSDPLLLAPPSLSLEYITTDDPFQPTPKAFDMSRPTLDCFKPGSEMNNVLDVQVPARLLLERASTDPLHGFGECTSLALHQRNVAPPPLSADFIVIGNIGVDSEWSLLGRAPPPLSLEYIATDDPFQPTPTAASWPEELQLLSETDSLLALREESCEVSSARIALAGLPPPPLLDFESLQTADPFEHSLRLPMPPLTEDPCEASLDMDDWSSRLPGPSLLEFEAKQLAALFEHQAGQPILTPPLRTLTPPLFEFASMQAAASQPMYVALPMMPVKLLCPPPMLAAPVLEPAPPTRPPSMPAPNMATPGVPEAPRAPPSRTPGASAAALVKADLRKSGMLVRAGGDCTHVHWAVDARKLERQDKQLVSPVFMVALPAHGLIPFKIVLYAKDGAVNGKKGAGFVKAKGRGRVVLKCESQLPENSSDIAFRIGVGRGDVLQPFRGPITHNFAEHSCHGLSTDEEEWDFSASIDEHKTFMVTLEIAPHTTLCTNANIWWSALEQT